MAVASNFFSTLEKLQADFEATSPYRLELSSGATGKHYAQLRQGAPFDVFLAADAERPALLEEEGWAIPETRASYALGRLALWIPQRPGGDPPAGQSESPAISAEQALRQALRSNPGARIAIANPRLAPYGLAAEAWLATVLEPGGRHGQGGQDDQGGLQLRRVTGENVGQAFHFVASGSVPMGIVALSQLRGTGEQGRYWVIGSAAHPPIHQQLVLLRDIPATRAFHQWLLSPRVQGQLVELGYGADHAEQR